MKQQINLYQPIFREERKLFSLKTAAIALGLVSIGLVVIWAIGAKNVASLQHNVEQLQRQLVAQEHMAEKAGIMLGGQGSASNMQAQVQQLSARLAERTRALDLLRNGAAGEPKGFAPRLLALANQHTEGVWLDRLFLGSRDSGVSLQGRSINAELVPKYLQSLTSEPELAGTRFDEVVLDRHERHDDDDKLAPPVPVITGVPAKAFNRNEKHDPDNTSTVRFSVSSSKLLETLSSRNKTSEHTP